ncbi:polyphenol oxidase, chloroplastic-like [Dorcoceras hygrometricum]|uniref:Polyphenol oxidase, chloroplastic-like n=1 Tax=Dorcoceras hygrometricum TaxID=472368 RepID=A0A2Z7BKL0_9LAMI|nr:polyphenol oxidase, chloroplastic-like [Dorcoceras hygrometricum]
MAGLAMETSKADPANRNQAKAKLTEMLTWTASLTWNPTWTTILTWSPAWTDLSSVALNRRCNQLLQAFISCKQSAVANKSQDQQLIREVQEMERRRLTLNIEPAGVLSCCGNVNESDVDVKRNLVSAMMMSAFILEEAVFSNYDISNISRQQDVSAIVTSAVMSSQSAVSYSRISSYKKEVESDRSDEQYKSEENRSCWTYVDQLMMKSKKTTAEQTVDESADEEETDVEAEMLIS